VRLHRPAAEPVSPMPFHSPMPLMGAEDLALSPPCCEGKRDVSDVADDQNQLVWGNKASSFGSDSEY
jgi:hypothetical protein